MTCRRKYLRNAFSRSQQTLLRLLITRKFPYLLKANFDNEPRVHPIHAGLHSHGGSLRFRDDASRGAIFAADGEIEMPVTTIDDVLGDRRLTYVKMNIEGAEIDALRGGRNAIRKWRPRLAISVYHRASDLWRIPQQVLELNPDYELYLRQHDGGIIETVLYALPSSRGASGSRTLKQDQATK